MKNLKNTFDSVIANINSDVTYKLTIGSQFQDMKIYLTTFDFELLWNILASGVHFKDIFEDPNDEEEFNFLLDDLNEKFEYDLNKMTIDDYYCAGFAIAKIILKNPMLDKFAYNKEYKIFEYVN